MNIRHVRLSETATSWRVEQGDTSIRVVLDDYHNEIILLHGSPTSRVLISDTKLRKWRSYQMRLGKSVDVLSAKMAPDRTCFALRVSEKEVKIVKLSGEVVSSRSCKRSRSRILAIHWLKNGLLLYVTSRGVELYACVSSMLKGPVLKHVKTAPYDVQYHWFLPEGNILLLVNKKCIFQAYALSSKTISKLCRFVLDSLLKFPATACREPTKDNFPFHRHQISLCSLYGRMVCLFVHEVKGQLHVLGLQNDTMVELHSYYLFDSGTYVCSVVDNVIVMHNRNAQVCILYDIRINSEQALTGPLPIGTRKNKASPSFQDTSHWRLEFPNFVIDYTEGDLSGHMYTLELDLEMIAHSWDHQEIQMLIPFLLQRSSALSKKLILAKIRDLVVNGSLRHVSRVFNHINRVIYDQNVYKQTNNLHNVIAVKSSGGGQQRTRMYSSAQRSSLDEDHLKPRDGAGSPSNSMAEPPTPTTPSTHTTTSTTATTTTNATENDNDERSPSDNDERSPSDNDDNDDNDDDDDDDDDDDSSDTGEDKGSDAAPTRSRNDAPPTTEGSSSSETLRSASRTINDETNDIRNRWSEAAEDQIERSYMGRIIINQWEVYEHVFLALKEDPNCDASTLISVVSEYLRSIYKHYLKAEQMISAFLVTLLIENNRLFELHQYLQYNILDDSVAVAEQLLELSARFPAAYQLGLDMLYREKQHEKLALTLLERKQIIPSLRCMRSHTNPLFKEKGLGAADFLRIALDSEDQCLFYTTYKFFEQRNFKLRDSPDFLPSDACGEYVTAFKEMFGSEKTRERKSSQSYESDSDEDVLSDEEAGKAAEVEVASSTDATESKEKADADAGADQEPRHRRTTARDSLDDALGVISGGDDEEGSGADDEEDGVVV